MLKRVTVALLASAAALASTVALAPAAGATASGLCNHSNGTIGIIHNEDGHYTKGLYDALLPVETQVNGCSFQYPIGWEHVAGYYVGPDRCIVFRDSYTGGARIGGLDGGSAGRQGWFRSSYGDLFAYVYASGDPRCTAA